MKNSHVDIAETVDTAPSPAIDNKVTPIDIFTSLRNQTARAEPARLKPGLVLNVSVLVGGKKELDEQAKRISDEGTVILPLLGRMRVAEMSLEELSKQLTRSYERYFVKPEVIVDFVRDTSADGVCPWGYITVLGRVKNPGRVAIPPTRDMTISGSIQKAGGFASSARIGKIIVTRHAQSGESHSREVDLDAVGADGKTEDDIIVESGDVVFVPENRF